MRWIFLARMTSGISQLIILGSPWSWSFSTTQYTFTMISKYFAIQEQTKFVYLVSIVLVVSHCLANYVFVVVLKLGLYGLGIAALVSRIFPLALSFAICCVMIKQGQFAWNGFSSRALLGWKPMVSLGISGALNVFAENALFEISIFCSQFDGATAFSVLIIAIQLLTIWWSARFVKSNTDLCQNTAL